MDILIIGCGYLGIRAARLWRESGYQVSAVTRTDANAERFDSMGLRPVIADVTQPQTLTHLPPAETVLFSVGFDRTKYCRIEDVYVKGLGNVLDHLGDQTRQFVYISSTGVFGDAGGEWVDESTEPCPQRPGGEACLKAEQLIRNSRLADKSSILRLAGIYGRNRIPGSASIERGDWSKLSPAGHLNLIHVDDAAEIILEIVRQKVRNDLFLVSDGHPVNRQAFYDFVAEQLRVGPIDWSCNSDRAAEIRSRADRKICNRKLIQQTGYRFRFPDYRSGIRASLLTEPPSVDVPATEP